MIIQQTAEELTDSMALNHNSALLAVRVTEAEMWSAPPADWANGGEAETQIGFHPAAVRREEDSLGLTIEFRFGLGSLAESPANLVKVGCRFEALYALASGFQPTDEQIAAFHKGNAVFNCWPFFREFVQNAAVRMHIPPPPVPFLRMMPAATAQQAMPPPREKKRAVKKRGKNQIS